MSIKRPKANTKCSLGRLRRATFLEALLTNPEELSGNFSSDLNGFPNNTGVMPNPNTQVTTRGKQARSATFQQFANTGLVAACGAYPRLTFSWFETSCYSGNPFFAGRLAGQQDYR